MNTRWKMLIITLIFGAAAFLLGPVLWAPSPEIHPTPAQLPYFIVLSGVEALLFGFGVAFIMYGRKLVKSVTDQSGKVSLAMYLSLAWLLVSWWPHDNLHLHNALDLDGLIGIEYGFHFTLMVASLVLVWSFFALLKPATAREEMRGECPADQPDCHLTPLRP